MQILYRQPQKNPDEAIFHLPFEEYGIEACYMKQVQISDVSKFTKQRHSHTSFEIHIIESGYQTYETEDGTFKINSGYFLIIPQGKGHRLLDTSSEVRKIAFTFTLVGEAGSSLAITLGEVPKNVKESISYVISERKLSKGGSELLVANRVFECVLTFLRLIGAVKDTPSSCGSSCDGRLELAKQYINDNILSQLQISAVAEYCHISERQLARLFLSEQQEAPAAYIRRQKIKQIEKLLCDSSLTLKEISDLMCFASEYHFNAFFKKYYGMPPGQYRKMVN